MLLSRLARAIRSSDSKAASRIDMSDHKFNATEFIRPVVGGLKELEVVVHKKLLHQDRRLIDRGKDPRVTKRALFSGAMTLTTHQRTTCQPSDTDSRDDV